VPALNIDSSVSIKLLKSPIAIQGMTLEKYLVCHSHVTTSLLSKLVI